MQRYRRSEVMTAVLLLLPFVVVYGVLFVYPTAKMVMMTFTKAPLIGEGEWVGLANYRALFAEGEFSQALANTIYFVAVIVPVGSALSLGLALLLDTKLRGVGQSAPERSCPGRWLRGWCRGCRT